MEIKNIQQFFTLADRTLLCNTSYPIFTDLFMQYQSEEDGFNMSVAALEALEEKPSVVAVTHFLGFPCEIERIATYVHSYGGFVLQDACETLGIAANGVACHKYGDITTWSFYHPHHLSAYGGGAVVTLNTEDYILADSVIHWGRSCKCHITDAVCTVPAGSAHQFTYERPGLNVEMSELNARFGRWQLQQWDSIEVMRKRNYRILYDTLCHNPHIKVFEHPEINISAFAFPIQLTDGRKLSEVYETIKSEGIEVRTLMGGACNEQKAFSSLFNKSNTLNAHILTQTAFFVGIHHTLPEEDVRDVAKKLNAVL